MLLLKGLKNAHGATKRTEKYRCCFSMGWKKHMVLLKGLRNTVGSSVLVDWRIQMVLLKGLRMVLLIGLRNTNGGLQWTEKWRWSSLQEWRLKNTDDAPRSTEKYRCRLLKDGGLCSTKTTKNWRIQISLLKEPRAPRRTKEYRWCS
jgi:hypothetical protein